MIDAYTIGITLALDDGVSSGIAAIRKELMLLDGAVKSAASAMSGMHALAGVADWTRFGDIPAKSLARPVSTAVPVAADTLQALEPAVPPVQSSSAAPTPEWPADCVRPFTPMSMPATAEVTVRPAPVFVGITPPPATVRPDAPPSRKTAQVVSALPVAAAPTVPPPPPRAEAPSAPAAVLPEKLAVHWRVAYCPSALQARASRHCRHQPRQRRNALRYRRGRSCLWPAFQPCTLKIHRARRSLLSKHPLRSRRG